MTIRDLLVGVLFGGVMVAPTACAAWLFVALARHRPRWPALVCLLAFAAGAAAAIPVARNTAAGIADEQRWWVLVSVVCAFCGNCAALAAFLATRKWTREANINGWVGAVWVFAMVLQMSFLLRAPT